MLAPCATPRQTASAGRLNHARGWCSHCTTRRMSCFWQPTAKGQRRSWTDPMAECEGVNPPNQEWNPEGLYSRTVPAAPATELVPNVLLCIPLDYIGEAERGNLDDWASQDLHTLCPGLRPGEVTLVPLLQRQHNTGDGSNELYAQSGLA